MAWTKLEGYAGLYTGDEAWDALGEALQKLRELYTTEFNRPPAIEEIQAAWEVVASPQALKALGCKPAYEMNEEPFKMGALVEVVNDDLDIPYGAAPRPEIGTLGQVVGYEYHDDYEDPALWVEVQFALPFTDANGITWDRLDKRGKFTMYFLPTELRVYHEENQT